MGAETPERWARIEEVVDRALDLPAEARAAFIRSACGPDSELHAAVEGWLAACDAPTLVPDTSAAAFAAPLLDGLLSEHQGLDAFAYGGEGRSAPGAPDAGDRRIGAYRVVREIGRGGMGTVYLAERDDGQFTRRVALKVMKRGAGGEFVEAGGIRWDTGELPVNTSGGHLSEAYMQGMNQLLEGVRQVRGESTSQVKDVEVSFVDTGVGTGAAIFTKEP